MVRIAITEAAFEAIAQTLPLGSVGYEKRDQRTNGANVVDRLSRTLTAVQPRRTSIIWPATRIAYVIYGQAGPTPR